LKAIFLADSSCRVSLLGRSCFYALDLLINRLENIINKIVTFQFQAAFNEVKDKERACIIWQDEKSLDVLDYHFVE
jgi:hypothetical protein